jgi:hypothetical protein
MATPSNTHAGTGVVRALTLSVVAIQQNVLFVGYWTRVPLHLCMSVSISALLFLLSPFSTPEDRYHTTDKDSIKFTYKIRDRRISRCRLELMKCRSLGSGTAQCVPECVTHTHILASLLSISLSSVFSLFHFYFVRNGRTLRGNATVLRFFFESFFSFPSSARLRNLSTGTGKPGCNLYRLFASRPSKLRAIGMNSEND